MHRILSGIFMFLLAGLIFTVFLYVASIVIPVLLLICLVGWGWLKYKQGKSIKLMFGQKYSHSATPKGEIIDAEYEIIDDGNR